MACTLGRFYTNAESHGLTTVSGELEFSLDVRAYGTETLAELESQVLDLIRQVESRRKVLFDLGARAEAPVGPCSPRLISELADIAAKLGIAFDHMGSPASHDAAAFAQAGVSIGMIFVRNRNGSHNPDEHMDINDFLAGTAVLSNWLQLSLHH
jgi:N-carbamoyl-L-amino-acid hydrolase